MYEALYQYLLLHRQLDIPGVGCFQLERKPADIDFANKVIQPPLFTMALNASAEADPPVRLFRWLSDKLDITESDAIDRFNSFAGDLRREILSGKKLQWTGVGVLSKGLAGEIKFEPSLKDSPAGPAVPAVKVLREKALHSVRVGRTKKPLQRCWSTSTRLLHENPTSGSSRCWSPFLRSFSWPGTSCRPKPNRQPEASRK